MASNYETFFDLDRYAVIGHTAKKPFPILTYRGLKARGKQVRAVDPSTRTIDGDECFPDLTALPSPVQAPVQAVVIETPRDEVKDWVAEAARLGIKDVWIHMAHETPEALAIAGQQGLNLRTGTCAVMYVQTGLSYHAIHKFIMQALKKY